MLIDRVAAEELAAFYGTKAKIWEGVAHDSMLDAGWRTAADSLAAWLAGLPPAGAAE